MHQIMGAPILPYSLRSSSLVVYRSPICPQPTSIKYVDAALIGVPDDLVPEQNFKQDEFECLNLNITCPAGLTPQSRLPVMLWVHGYVVGYEKHRHL
jgi:carboxylesterase type B